MRFLSPGVLLHESTYSLCTLGATNATNTINHGGAYEYNNAQHCAFENKLIETKRCKKQHDSLMSWVTPVAAIHVQNVSIKANRKTAPKFIEVIAYAQSNYVELFSASWCNASNET